MSDLASGKDMLRAATNTLVLIVSSMWQCLRPKCIKNSHGLMKKAFVSGTFFFYYKSLH